MDGGAQYGNSHEIVREEAPQDAIVRLTANRNGPVVRTTLDVAPRVDVVVISRDRLPELLTTLGRLTALPDVGKVIVVDNASSDGTTEAVKRFYPSVSVQGLSRNIGSTARTIGVEQCRSEIVAFTDDDSGWAPGAMSKAVALFNNYPNLALVQARILVNDEKKLDPTCRLMANSMPFSLGAPGIPISGFLACGAIVRRAAYMQVGGFNPKLGFGGEEALLAIDLLQAGWDIQYVEEVVAHHWPSPARDRGQRLYAEYRNELWTSWLRRPPAQVARRTLVTAKRAAGGDRHAALALIHALRGLLWIIRQRQVVSPNVEQTLRLCELARLRESVNAVD